VRVGPAAGVLDRLPAGQARGLKAHAVGTLCRSGGEG
jgi:hypothetical protein